MSNNKNSRHSHTELLNSEQLKAHIMSNYQSRNLHNFDKLVELLCLLVDNLGHEIRTENGISVINNKIGLDGSLVRNTNVDLNLKNLFIGGNQTDENTTIGFVTSNDLFGLLDTLGYSTPGIGIIRNEALTEMESYLFFVDGSDIGSPKNMIFLGMTDDVTKEATLRFVDDDGKGRNFPEFRTFLTDADISNAIVQDSEGITLYFEDNTTNSITRLILKQIAAQLSFDKTDGSNVYVSDITAEKGLATMFVDLDDGTDRHQISQELDVDNLKVTTSFIKNNVVEQEIIFTKTGVNIKVLPTFDNDVDADAALNSGDLYHLTGSRITYRKP